MRSDLMNFPAAFAASARIVLLSLAGASLLGAGAPALAKAKAKEPAAKSEEAATDAKHDKHAKDAHGKDAHTKDAHAKDAHDQAGHGQGAHGKDAHGKDAHGKDQHGKADAKPEQLASFGDWGAFATHGGNRTCYALAAPKERAPKGKVKEPAYVFISTRPAENVKNEVAINLGYPTKDSGTAAADIDGDGFELVLKGTNAWIKNPAEEPKFVKALKEGTKLTVKATAAKGFTSTDSYSLEGLSKALDRVQQECR